MAVPTTFGIVTLLFLGLVVALARTTSAAFDSTDDQSTADGMGSQSGTASEPTAGTAQPRRSADYDSAPGVIGPEADESTSVGTEQADQSPTQESPAVPADHSVAGDTAPDSEAGAHRTGPSTAPDDLASVDLTDLSATWLYANVLATQGVLAGILIAVGILTGVSWSALGVGAPAMIDGSSTAVAYGVALGVALYIGNQAIASNLDRLGVEYSNSLRSSLAPESVGGWLVLFLVVLPVIAGFEELLFRAAAIGGLSTWLGVSPWLFVVGSSIVFAVGHGLQGPGGVLVTGLLGVVLGVAFVATNSLLLVIVAHYVINALEFGIHEGLEISGG